MLRALLLSLAAEALAKAALAADTLVRIALLGAARNMATVALTLTFTALAAMATAQNLVRNPSFEDTTKCTGWHPLYTEAEYWYNPNTATPDIYDADLDRQCGRPMNPVNNWYLAPFDGLRHAAGFQWYGPNSSNTREYFMSQLLEPLVAGQAYRVSLYYARRSINHSAIDRIGVYFGPDSIFQDNPNTLQVTPQVELFAPDSSFLESTDWVQLVDTFVAAGGEQWIIFGTFNDANDVNGIIIPPGWDNSAYYFFDLVGVVPVDGHSGVGDGPVSGSIAVYGGMFHWNAPVSLEGARMVDMAGRLVHAWPAGSAARGSPALLPQGMAPGVYLITAWGGGTRYAVRFVKEEGGR